MSLGAMLAESVAKQREDATRLTLICMSPQSLKAWCNFSAASDMLRAAADVCSKLKLVPPPLPLPHRRLLLLLLLLLGVTTSIMLSTAPAYSATNNPGRTWTLRFPVFDPEKHRLQRIVSEVLTTFNEALTCIGFHVQTIALKKYILDTRTNPNVACEVMVLQLSIAPRPERRDIRKNPKHIL